METTNIVDFARRDGITDALTDLLKAGAQHLIATAVETELAAYLGEYRKVWGNCVFVLSFAGWWNVCAC